MTIKAILLDKDGTLVDFDRTWGPAAWHVMEAFADGDPAALARLVAASRYDAGRRRFLPDSPLVGGSTAQYAPLWAAALGRTADAAFLARKDDLFRHWGLRSLSPIGEPAAILADLTRRGLALGIATNDAEASAHAQAERLELEVGFVAGYDSGFGSKPDPAVVHAFARWAAVRPDEVALVGDSVHDLLTARAAGAVSVAVLTGPALHGARKEVEPHADVVLDSLADLPAWLDRHGASAAAVGGQLAAGA